MRSYAWVYDQTTELIRQRSLTALIVYNGRFTHDQAAAAAAEKAGIQVLYYDAGGLDNGFDLTTATTHDWQHLQQRMLRMWANWPDAESQDRHASQESRGDRESLGRQWFENRQAHKEPGIEVFVGQQKRGHLEGVPDAEQLVVFFSSSGDEIAELDLDWAEYLGSQENALRTLAEVCRSRPGTELVVRTHPHMRLKPEDDLQRWRAAVEAATPSMHIDATSPVDSYALMRAADVVFTYGSTSGVEAAFIGRPVAVMGPSAYDVIGCATRIRSSEDIEKFLVNPPVPQPDEALKYGLMMQRRGFNYEFLAKDALGTIRVGDVALDDPSELVKKLSHAKRAKRTRWLTAS